MKDLGIGICIIGSIIAILFIPCQFLGKRRIKYNLCIFINREVKKIRKEYSYDNDPR